MSETIPFVDGKSFINFTFIKNEATRITAVVILPVKHMSSITQVKHEVDYQDFRVCDIKEVTVLEAVSGTRWSGYSLVEEMGQKALRAGVELAQDYLADNKRNNNQGNHVISSRVVKRGGPPRKKKIYTLKHASDSSTVKRVC